MIKGNKLGALLAIFLIAGMAGCGAKENTHASITSSTVAAPAAAIDSAALAAQGKELFSQNCITCHGPDGKGDGVGSAALVTKPRDFNDAAYMNKLTDSEIRNTIKYGGSFKAMPLMPPNPQYSDDDLRALVAYVRTFSKAK